MQMDRLTITLLISSTDSVLYQAAFLSPSPPVMVAFWQREEELTFQDQEVSYLSVPQSPQLRGSRCRRDALRDWLI